MRSELWLAVRYPEGGRFDLGMLEMLLTIPLAAAFLLLRRSPRPPGFFVGALALAYAPVRFGLDFLRARDTPLADPRYAGLTPAQWACVPLALLGAVMLVRAFRSGSATPPVRSTP
jgi:phosphatidylglycerol---prolipoprotein diacylglyceryl transferase